MKECSQWQKANWVTTHIWLDGNKVGKEEFRKLGVFVNDIKYWGESNKNINVKHGRIRR